MYYSVLIVASLLSAGPLDWPANVESCRPWAYNWWLGSAVDRTNLQHEFDRYRAGGLGGIHVVPIYGAKGAEARAVPYLTPKWLTLFSFAVHQARQRGLGVDLTTGTGWCFGGPRIPPELGGRLVVVKRIPFPASGRLPADLHAPRTTLQAVVAVGPRHEVQNMTDQVQPDGVVQWHPPAGGWSLLVLGHRFSGRMVKRAAPGGSGPMINPYSPRAMQVYLQRFTAAFDSPGVARPRAMYHDSFEYQSDWSPDFPDRFAARRGYRIESELAALAGEGEPDRVARVRCDVSETLSDLVVEDVFPQWVRWCHERHMKTRNQAHGARANWLDFYALADVPETEMFGHGGPNPLVSRFDQYIGGADRDILISKFASAAAHVSGKPLVSAETGTWLAEHFCGTFEELKCEIDLLFLAGVNHIFYHGCVYSPDDAAWPGWLFYASTQLNPRNPLWREIPVLNRYVARCQSVLRAGRPANELLVYWPIHDAWASGVGNMSVHNKAALRGPLGDVARLLWRRGYSFDYVSDRLLQTLTVRDGVICGPHDTEWTALIVPRCAWMPVATLAKLLKFARQGVPLVFQDRLPRDVPGLGHLAARRAQARNALLALEQLARTSPGDDPSSGPAAPATGQAPDGRANETTPAHSEHGTPTPKPRVFVGDVEWALRAGGVPRERLVDRPGLQFVRRKFADGYAYLVVYHGLEPWRGTIPLATKARSVVIMDALTGRTGMAATDRTADGTLQVHVTMEGGQSLILRTFTEAAESGKPWAACDPGAPIKQITGPWSVKFVAGGPRLPAPVQMATLKPWTDTDDPARLAFSGTAQYRCQFNLPPGNVPTNQPLVLDLGEVRHVARIKLNQHGLGTVIMHPYRVLIPADLLHSGRNTLEIEVTNLAANRIRDLDRRGVQWRIFHDINFVSIKYGPFDASKWPVFESGLLGPVRVLHCN